MQKPITTGSLDKAELPPGQVKVHLDGITKRYGSVLALHEVNLKVFAGEFLTLLGPSGSGKTTLLNVIAGMTQASSGRVWIDGRDATDLPPGRRDLGMVFQNYALMPHMTVFENIAFPLRVRKIPNADISRKVMEVLEQVRLTGLERRKPAELSGGQQQRVSVARCIVYNPALILMDEPLGALDKKLREEMQLELKRLHATLGVTALYVTHDQEEALTMSDRIMLMNKGEVEQVGTPDELYFYPRSIFAAEFLGNSNIISGRLEEAGPPASIETAVGRCECEKAPTFASAGHQVTVLIRPENIILSGEARDGPNQATAQMIDSISFGGVIKSFVRLADGKTMVVQELNRSDRYSAAQGDTVTVSWNRKDAIVLPQSGRIGE